MTDPAAIQTQDLTKTFGLTVAVDALTLRIERGEIFGLLGPNGAGKTTTVRLLCGLLSPQRGTARVAGYSISDRLNVAQVTGLLPETPGLYERLSVFRNLELFAEIYRVDDRAAKINHYLKLFDLWDHRDQPAGGLSKGMRQKVALARALIHDPQILFLDEPTASLDPLSAKVIRELILALKARARTVVICTHNLFEAEQMCDRVGIMSRGRLITVDTPSQIKQTIRHREVVYTLAEVTEAVWEALRHDFIKAKRRNGNKLILSLEHPEIESPHIVDALVQAGGRIIFITEQGPSLEEVYLRLTQEE
jgi:ABC-2 type transport system ATP-binding protein